VDATGVHSADVRHRSCPSTQAFEMLKCRDPAHINSQLAPRIAPTSSLLDSDTLHQAQCEQPVGRACPRWTLATGFAAPAAGRGSHRADTQLMAWPSAVQSSFTGHGTMARLGLSQETVCSWKALMESTHQELLGGARVGAQRVQHWPRLRARRVGEQVDQHAGRVRQDAVHHVGAGPRIPKVRVPDQTRML